MQGTAIDGFQNINYFHTLALPKFTMHFKRYIFTLAAIAFSAALSAQCNGDKNLCHKRYSDVAFLITNNAYTPFHSELIGDQSHTIAQQLQNDVDGLVLNVDMLYGQPVVYYRSTILGERALKEVLVDVKKRLNEVPEKVLTILFNSKMPVAEWSYLLSDCDLIGQIYIHPGGPWPTLREMVDGDQRLVLFTLNNDSQNQPWIQQLNHFSKWAARDLCQKDAPEKILGADMPRDLLLMDHHSKMKVSEKVDDLQWVNSRKLLLQRATKCWDMTGNIPNLIVVDHYQIGEVKSALKMINNLTEGLAENVDPRNFEIVRDPVMDYSTIDFRGYIKKGHKLEIWEVDGMQVASVENVEYEKMYIPRMSLAFGNYHYRVMDPENKEVMKGDLQLN